MAPLVKQQPTSTASATNSSATKRSWWRFNRTNKAAELDSSAKPQSWAASAAQSVGSAARSFVFESEKPAGCIVRGWRKVSGACNRDDRSRGQKMLGSASTAFSSGLRWMSSTTSGGGEQGETEKQRKKAEKKAEKKADKEARRLEKARRSTQPTGSTTQYVSTLPEYQDPWRPPVSGWWDSARTSYYGPYPPPQSPPPAPTGPPTDNSSSIMGAYPSSPDSSALPLTPPVGIESIMRGSHGTRPSSRAASANLTAANYGPTSLTSSAAGYGNSDPSMGSHQTGSESVSPTNPGGQRPWGTSGAILAAGKRTTLGY